MCEKDANGYLTDINERTHIISTVDGPMMTEDGQTYRRLSEDAIVSMNMWGFPQATMRRFEEAFPAFLTKALAENPEKAEFFLPSVVDGLLRKGEARVSVSTTHDRWYGVTYREDRPVVADALARLSAEGLYPSPLWKA